MKPSIVIPVLNEAERIESQVRRCLALVPRPEVIVVDGGSRDGTLSRAGLRGARVMPSPRRGRAFQMNAGAATAGGDVLVFLHADVILDQRAYEAMLDSLRDPELAGGAFRRRFDSPSVLLQLGCRLADLRGRWIGVFLGDQAIFVRRPVFDALGGFPEIPLFEDLEFSRSLARHGRTTLVRATVTASGRRFRRGGNLGQLLKNLYLTGRYFWGTDPARLAELYDPGALGGAGGVPSAPRDASLRGAGSGASRREAG